MASTIVTVLGAHYDNEGKGSFVDYFANNHKGKDVYIARINGGVNAGHTVELKNGLRHVFSHFSAGTLSGARTILAREFVCNPTVFRKEREELLAKGVIPPKPYVDEDCMVTTPYDSIINQLASFHKRNPMLDTAAVYTTMVRENNCSFRVPDSPRILRDIRFFYRKNSEFVSSMVDPYKTHWEDKKTENTFAEDFEYFKENTTICNSNKIDKCDTLIFEGSGGLLQDRELTSDYKMSLPYRTASFSIREIEKTLECDRSTVKLTYYVTRPYITKQTANEPKLKNKTPISKKIKDFTNFNNSWIGDIEYFPLHLRHLREYVTNSHTLPGGIRLAVSCMDHIDSTIRIFDRRGLSQELEAPELTRAITELYSHSIFNCGPTRDTIQEF